MFFGLIKYSFPFLFQRGNILINIKLFHQTWVVDTTMDNYSSSFVIDTYQVWNNFKVINQIALSEHINIKLIEFAILHHVLKLNYCWYCASSPEGWENMYFEIKFFSESEKNIFGLTDVTHIMWDVFNNAICINASNAVICFWTDMELTSLLSSSEMF